MTFHELEDVVGSISYKPGYELLVNKDIDQAVVMLRTRQPDSRGVEFHPIKLVSNAALNLYQLERMSRAEVIEWVRHSVIWAWEQHEADEWFFVDGKIWFDPHA